MKKGGIGGGKTITGTVYEEKVDLSSFLESQQGYSVIGTYVYYQSELVARIVKKHGFYDFLAENGIDWKKYLSSKLIPDNCLYVITSKTLFVIEVKTQHVGGSVDEKLQTCDFKKKQYQKLFSQRNIKVEYVYILDDWFRSDKYKDVLEYISSVKCQYYFNYIPLSELGLPVPEK